MKKSLLAMLLTCTSAHVLAEDLVSLTCSIAEDAARVVMAERQDGISKSKYTASINKLIKEKEGVFSPLFLDQQRAMLGSLIEEAFKIPVSESEDGKMRAIEEFGFSEYEACQKEEAEEID